MIVPGWPARLCSPVVDWAGRHEMQPAGHGINELWSCLANETWYRCACAYRCAGRQAAWPLCLCASFSSLPTMSHEPVSCLGSLVQRYACRLCRVRRNSASCMIYDVLQGSWRCSQIVSNNATVMAVRVPGILWKERMGCQCDCPRLFSDTEMTSDLMLACFWY